MSELQTKTRLRTIYTVTIAFLVSALLISDARSQETDSSNIDDCYLFVDGEYILPPYSVTVDEASISINGKEYGEDYFDLSDFNRARGSGRAGMGQRKGPMGRRQGNPESRNQTESGPLANLFVQFERPLMGSIFVLYKDEKPVIFSDASIRYDVMRYLSNNGEVSESSIDESVLRSRSTLDRLLKDLHPREQFLSRAAVDLKAIEDVVFKNERSISANKLVDKITYPLTAFAMVAIALACGHLLTYHPNSATDSENAVKTRHNILKLLAFVAVFSAIDLIWTLAASQTGSMRELNPLGSHLIEDPKRLIAFKFIATGISIGILYALRRRHIARVGAWWCCLLLTLLTARWVVFQSLFS